jgi:hypothetical protein
MRGARIYKLGELGTQVRGQASTNLNESSPGMVGGCEKEPAAFLRLERYPVAAEKERESTGRGSLGLSNGADAADS